MPTQAQRIGGDYSDWMAGVPDNAYLSQVSIPGSHDACTIFGSHYEYTGGKPGERFHFKWLQNVVFGYMNITKMIKAQELSLEDQLAARGPYVRRASFGVGLFGPGPPDPARHRSAGRPVARRLRARRDRPAGALALYAFTGARPLRALSRGASRRDGIGTSEVREHQRHRQNGVGQERRQPDPFALRGAHRRFPSPHDAGRCPGQDSLRHPRGLQIVQRRAVFGRLPELDARQGGLRHDSSRATASGRPRSG